MLKVILEEKKREKGNNFLSKIVIKLIENFQDKCVWIRDPLLFLDPDPVCPEISEALHSLYVCMHRSCIEVA